MCSLSFDKKTMPFTKSYYEKQSSVGAHHAHSRQVLSAINHLVFYPRGGKRVFLSLPSRGPVTTMGIEI